MLNLYHYMKLLKKKTYCWKDLNYSCETHIFVSLFIKCIYLFVCGLFKNAISSSDCSVLNDVTVNE